MNISSGEGYATLAPFRHVFAGKYKFLVNHWKSLRYRSVTLVAPTIDNFSIQL
jgi:hypothetical protein